ncbi:hypothetical protein CYV19_18180 [Natronobacterium gregoryi SP2]|uniref:Uncharacterized protein n=1 Tax=Natronobacterium gregoryi (strain ATCC 43098 / DSM 3393 / CCM 3738 / CIP 104747 / IAM 13177 / JCM 8860 / NBRC 102187 / NCIMB 2189 / SP2) TaxID=797304 RepID=A0A2J4JAB6_NATGS|nr:hypothetical protein CYV19_18180 [Natronobacterium gregoryi SP2]
MVGYLIGGISIDRYIDGQTRTHRKTRVEPAFECDWPDAATATGSLARYLDAVCFGLRSYRHVRPTVSNGFPSGMPAQPQPDAVAPGRRHGNSSHMDGCTDVPARPQEGSWSHRN